MGEFKAAHHLLEISRMNAGISEVSSALLLGRDSHIALQTLTESDKSRRAELRFDRIYTHIHFIPMNADGVRLIRMLILSDWNEKILSALFPKEMRPRGYSFMEYDAYWDGTYIYSHLDSDIARLIRFREALEAQSGKFEVLCFPWQAESLKKYLGDRVRLKQLAMDSLEAALSNRFSSKDHDGRNFTRSKSGTYGTAGWMSDKEMRKILEVTTPQKARGVILGQKNGSVLCLPENTRLNRHIAVLGATGTMKSRAIFRNVLFQAIRRGESVICTDPKAELYADTAELFRRKGYTVKVFNLVQPEYSDSWNCMADLNGDTLMAQVLTDVIIRNTSEGRGDRFWDTGEGNLLRALVLYVDQEASRGLEHKHLPAVYQMLINNTEKQLTAMFEKLPIGHPARAPYSLFAQIMGAMDIQLMLGCTDDITAEYFSARSGDMTVEVTGDMTVRQSIALAQVIPQYRHTQGMGRRRLLTPDEVLRLPQDELLIVLRSQSMLKAKKSDYTQHPMSRHIVRIPIFEYVPAQRAPEALLPQAEMEDVRRPIESNTHPAVNAGLYQSAKPPDGF